MSTTSSATTYANLTLERHDAVALVTVSRPEKLNALNRATLAEIDHMFGTLAADESVRAIVITGAGEKSFVAGADIGELSVLDTRGAEEASAFGSAIFRRIERMRAPVIAAVNGFALGGGCELAIACHIRYAADNARFGLPEVGLGIASELIATGRMIDANEALRIGLVNKVLPQAELKDAAMALAAEIATKAPLAVAAALEAARIGTETDLDTGLRLESSLFGMLGSTKDMHDGLTAFVEKKKIKFEGR